MTSKRWTWTSILVVSALFLTVVLLNGCGSSRAAGVQTDGRLAPCPSSPNCVCSQDPDADHRIAAIPFTGSATNAHQRLIAAIGTLPRINILSDLPHAPTSRYLHVTATTLIMRFTDDMEFIIDDSSKLIHMRSLSRVGHSDFGTNRRRMETIRAAFEQAAP